MRLMLLAVITALLVIVYSTPTFAVGEAGAISLTIPPGARAGWTG